MQPVYSSLKAFMDILLGTYTPNTYVDNGVTIIASGCAGVDWTYIVRAVAFLLVLYSVFRLVGGLFCK